MFPLHVISCFHLLFCHCLIDLISCTSLSIVQNLCKHTWTHVFIRKGSNDLFIPAVSIPIRSSAPPPHEDHTTFTTNADFSSIYIWTFFKLIITTFLTRFITTVNHNHLNYCQTFCDFKIYIFKFDFCPFRSAKLFFMHLLASDLSFMFPLNLQIALCF